MKTKKLFHCNKCKFSAKSSAGLINHQKAQHPPEKPIWRSFREYANSEWGKEALKKDFFENPSDNHLIYAVLLEILDELRNIKYALNRERKII